MVYFEVKVMVKIDVGKCSMLSNSLFLGDIPLAQMHFCLGDQTTSFWPPFHFEWTSPLMLKLILELFRYCDLRDEGDFYVVNCKLMINIVTLPTF